MSSARLNDGGKRPVGAEHAVFDVSDGETPARGDGWVARTSLMRVRLSKAADTKLWDWLGDRGV